MKALCHALAGLGRRLAGWPSRPGRDEGPPAWPPCVLALYRPVPSVAAPAAAPGSIGVFLHAYYPDLVPEMLDAVRHVPDRAAIFFSTDTAEKQAAILAGCAASGLADRTCVRVFPNQGWDIAPFLVGFGRDIPRYDLILRLHAKRSPHLAAGIGEAWRRLLYDALAGSPDQVERILGLFQADPGLGLVCPPILPHYANSVQCGANFARMRALLAPHGVRLRPDTPIDFPMGSMFWCRSRVLAPWLRLGLDFADFAPAGDGRRDGTLAHALERLFLFGCGLEGYGWTRISGAGISPGCPAGPGRPRP